MSEMQQVMAYFTFLMSILIGLQIYLHRQRRQDIRDMTRRLTGRMDRMGGRTDRIDGGFDRADSRFDRVYERFDRVENDIKILINDVGELKGAAGISTSGREREPAGTAD